MFPEYTDLVNRLKATDVHFTELYEKHAALDRRIKGMEAHNEPATHEQIEVLKKEKLRIKDHLYDQLRKASSVGA